MVCPVGWKSGESMISGVPPLPTARGPVGVLLLRRSALMCGGEANGGGDCSNSVVWFSHSGSRRQGVSSFHRRICLPVVETLQRRCDELGHGGSSPPVYIRHSATLKSSLLPFNVRLLSHLCSLFFWVLTSLSSHCGLELSALDYFHNVCGSWDCQRFVILGPLFNQFQMLGSTLSILSPCSCSSCGVNWF
ncbi:hypothetical protein F2Q69_00041738 [Brassica cretica]|uniref:Uncharacterized protein n=1 Tax=Brassica cretica TaxID=69181 RepID=A0A8S9N8D0_BRACR|nr:hypothetical protein F2Q69_00041738 [Brassica cretica]